MIRQRKDIGVRDSPGTGVLIAPFVVKANRGDCAGRVLDEGKGKTRNIYHAGKKKVS